MPTTIPAKKKSWKIYGLPIGFSPAVMINSANWPGMASAIYVRYWSLKTTCWQAVVDF
jgi:hypothetical protein